MSSARAWRGLCTGVVLGLVLDAGVLWGAALLWRAIGLLATDRWMVTT